MKKEIKWLRGVWVRISMVVIAFLFLCMQEGRIEAQEQTPSPNMVIPQTSDVAGEGTGSYGNYEYQIVSEARKSIAITKIKNYGETVVVPAKLNGYTVEYLGDIRNTEDYYIANREELHVFAKSDRTVKKLILSEGIRNIGESACEEMLALQEVVLPKSLLRINDYSFADCKALKKIELPENLYSIGSAAFYGCVLLKNWDLPSGLEYTGYDCFGRIKLDTIIVRGDISGEFNNTYNVKKMIFCGKRDYIVDLNWNGVYKVICRPQVKSISCWGSARKVYIQGKKTRIIDEKNPKYQVFTVAGAACMKGAKNCGLDVTVCKLPKLKVTSTKKNGKNMYIWNGGKAVIKKYSYPGSRKAKLRSTKKRSLVYEISFKQKGKKTYETVKTIKNTKWFTKKKGKVRVTAMAKNYWP